MYIKKKRNREQSLEAHQLLQETNLNFSSSTQHVADDYLESLQGLKINSRRNHSF